MRNLRIPGTLRPGVGGAAVTGGGERRPEYDRTPMRDRPADSSLDPRVQADSDRPLLNVRVTLRGRRGARERLALILAKVIAEPMLSKARESTPTSE